MKTLIVIPALNPSSDLLNYVSELKESGLKDILIVDDGSGEHTQYIFNELAERYQCKVLKHAKNLGKGRALKNAFNYFLTLPELSSFNGVVTADSDGQHLVKDVIRMANALDQNPDSLVLGCRDFDSDNVPPKSKFGNKLTRLLLRLLYGRKVTDTQTGLRGFPTSIIAGMLDVDGERFEYETEMLMYAFKENLSIPEITIDTVYFDNNAETHFNPILDSIRIYRVIFATFFKYLLASASSFIVDIGAFQLLLMLGLWLGISRGSHLIVGATVLARVVSATFNFFVNKNLVFKGEKRLGKTLVKYSSLALVQMLISAILVSYIWSQQGGAEVIIKIIVDTILFLISYQVQQKWVFRKDSSQQ